MINLLERRTNITSGSLKKAGITELAKIFSHEFSAMGFDIDTPPGGQIDMLSCPGSDHSIDLADHVLSSKSGNGKRLLLMGHLNTVFPPYSPFQSYRRRGDRVPAPSVADKKGGLMVMLHALKALDARGLLEDMAVDD
jgi:glutamate carboxypeptidase